SLELRAGGPVDGDGATGLPERDGHLMHLSEPGDACLDRPADLAPVRAVDPRARRPALARLRPQLLHLVAVQWQPPVGFAAPRTLAGHLPRPIQPQTRIASCARSQTRSTLTGSGARTPDSTSLKIATIASFTGVGTSTSRPRAET